MNTTDLIKQLRQLAEMPSHGLICETLTACALALDRLTSGDVKMPSPAAKSWDADEDTQADAWTLDQVQDYGDRRAAAAVLGQEPNSRPLWMEKPNLGFLKIRKEATK